MPRFPPKVSIRVLKSTSVLCRRGALTDFQSRKVIPIVSCAMTSLLQARCLSPYRSQSRLADRHDRHVSISRLAQMTEERIHRHRIQIRPCSNCFPLNLGVLIFFFFFHFDSGSLVKETIRPAQAFWFVYLSVVEHYYLGLT